VASREPRPGLVSTSVSHLPSEIAFQMINELYGVPGKESSGPPALSQFRVFSIADQVPTSAACSLGQVRVEIYRVFPKDSTDPPSGNVVTRMNSPSDIELADRDTASSNLTFTTTLLSLDFSAGNSVLNDINKKPNQTTMGEGKVTGEEVEFDVTFTTPFDLPADHYFFVPQVEITTAGEFMWLSAPKPIVAPGTPFLPDLQTWIRNEDLAPDWSRIGTDIEGQGRTFNASFSLTGTPEPSTWMMLAGALGLLALLGRKKLISR
jgi:hypothetical protein